MISDFLYCVGFFVSLRMTVGFAIVLFFSKNGYNKNNENKFFKKY